MSHKPQVEPQMMPEADAVRDKIRALTASAPSGRPTSAPVAVAQPPAAGDASLGGLALRLRTLAVFRGLLADTVLQKLLTYLDVLQNNVPLHARVAAYGDFVASLYESGYAALATYVQDAVNNGENILTRLIGRGDEPSSVLLQSMAVELRTLQAVADLTPTRLRGGLAWSGPLPEFETPRVDIAADYGRRIADAGRYGFGRYAQYTMFFLDEQGKIVPVRNPDRTRLSELVDYKREQQVILDNTRALLAGKPAANILLTGDAGTGKSSTVKAVVNELAGEGLRILEVRKHQLHAIPAILDELTENPLTFILFIDDLSFQRDDDNYAALKAILEGGVAAKSRNVAIYATSNRRHLVKERFSDRDGDDVHRNDTMQEALSLSERFGIQVSFYRPNKQTYLDIVRHLAWEAGIIASAEKPAELGTDPELTAVIESVEAEAERFALARGGRSARAARQFVDSLVARG